MQALLWFYCSAHVIRDGSSSWYFSGVVSSADGQLFTVQLEIDTASVM